MRVRVMLNKKIKKTNIIDSYSAFLNTKFCSILTKMKRKSIQYQIKSSQAIIEANHVFL